MGRWRKRKNQTKTPEGGSWGTKYDNIVKENSTFERYYKMQNIVPEEEWDSFIAHLKEPLPATFRITPYRSQAKMMLKTIQSEYFKDLTAEEMQPTCLSWYPDNLAWQLKLSKRDIRKSEVNVKLHNFLVAETDAGSISRQETVSMIPPIVLDVKPHHKVLDMCAAPGSKTAQLVEMLHIDEGMPEGLVVANDENNRRCYMLVHQLKRLQSPCVLITNHDASCMPNIRIPTPDGETLLKFDRILCDVPCTGDGTMRKNIDIWMKWNTANGCNLHGLQFRIARRGLEMLALNGQMVYSTCSLNPIEDEAVIHRLLVEAKGSVELVEIGHMLPGLKHCKGLSHWVITDRDLTAYDTPDVVPEGKRNLIRASIFPPKPEDAAQFNLDRCIRVLPHQQNTGGFFVAVVKKTGPLPWENAAKAAGVVEEKVEEKTEEPKEEPKVIGEKESGRRSPLRKKRRANVFKEDPFIFFDQNEPTWPEIRDFFGIIPSLDPTLLLTRSKEGKKKTIYIVNPLVRDITRANEGHLQIINTGVKMFARSFNKGSECDFRITEEGASILMKYMSKRRVTVNKDELIILLMNDLSELAPELARFSTETVEQLKKISTGSLLLEYNDDSLHIVLVGWKGDFSVRAFVPKNDRVHHLRLVGGDFSKYVVNKFQESGRNKGAKTGDAKENNGDEKETAGTDDSEDDEKVKVPDDSDDEVPVDA